MNTKQMKDLRLDIELANTSGVDVPTSDITTNTENISEKKSYDEILDEIVAKETIDVEGKNAGTTKGISNGFGRKCDKNVNGIENAGYLNDPDAMKGRTIKEIDLNDSAKVGNGRTGGNIGAVTRNEPVIITRDKSDATKKRKRDYKANLWKTVFLLWNITNLGWDYGQIGPIFPDLQDIAGVSLSQGSWFFTSFAVGYCFGCLISGFIQSKVNSHIMLFLYTMLSAGSMTLLPWIPTFEVMASLRALHGFGIGGQDTCVHSMLFGLWGHKVGPYFQMLHVLYAVGGVVSPLITKPFLREGQGTQVHDISSNTSLFQQNSTAFFNSTLSSITSAMPDDVIAKENSVHFALLITGIMNTSAAVPFLVIFLYRGETIKRQNVSVEGGGEKKPTILPRHIEVIVLCVFLLNSFVATAFVDLFPSLLTTFLMAAGMTQQVGSNLTSAYFALYAVGNFLMIFCSIYIALTKIMLFSYAGTSFLLAGVILCTIFPNEVLLSALVSLCGLSTAVIIPTIYTWINEHVTPVTGKIASGLLISGSLGISLNPLLAGYLMESYTPMWFIYLCLSKTVICTMLFIIALVLTKRFSTVKETNAGLKEDETNEIAEGQISISTYLNGKLQNTYECTHF